MKADKTDNETIPEIVTIKLTKKFLNDFIVWSTSRYNDYLGYGTKKENVDIVYASILKGYYVGWRGKENKEITKFEIQCSGGNGEGYGNRYWRLKGRRKSGNYQYIIDCDRKTITGVQTNETFKFTLPATALNHTKP